MHRRPPPVGPLPCPRPSPLRRPRRLITAENLKQELATVTSRLDEHLGDLARCIGLETLRMVKGQSPPSQVAAREQQLPADIKAQLEELRALADGSCEVDKPVSAAKLFPLHAQARPTCCSSCHGCSMQ